LFSAGLRADAQALLDSLAAFAEVERDSSLLRDALLTRGRHAASIGRAREAAPDLFRAEALARQTGQGPMARNAMRWWGYTRLSVGAYAAADSTYDRLLAESLATEDRYHEAHARFGAAYIDLLAGQRDLARAGYEHAIALFREGGAAREELFVLVGLARVLADDGDVRGARSVYADIVRRGVELGLKQPQAQALNNLASLEFELGSGDRAVQHYQAAIRLYEEAGETAEILSASGNLARCLYGLGRLDEARARLDSTIARAEVSDPRNRLMGMLILRADIARIQGDQVGAESQLARAIAEGNEHSVSDRLALLLARARTHGDADPVRASAELERDAPAIRALIGRPDVAGLDLLRARLLYASGNRGDALELAKQSAQIAAEHESRLTQLPALTLAARAARELGDGEQAESLLASALAAWESIRGTPRDPEWRERYGALSRDLAGEFVAQLMAGADEPDPSRVRSTFAVLQRFKARTFVERLTGFGALAGADSLRASSMREPVDVDSLQAVLGQNEVVLDLYAGEGATAAFVLSHDRLTLRRLPAEAELAARAEHVRELMSATEHRADAAAVEAAARAWAVEFLEAALGSGPLDRTLLVAPDRSWHAAPYEAIAQLLPESGLRIARVPSAQVLLELRLRRRAPGAAAPTAELSGLLIASSAGSGQALHGSVREARSLASRWSNLSARIDTPFDKDELARAGWLHFASHAAPDAQRPWNSALRVTQAGDSTRELTAYDVLSLPLAARLCVLSACESAAAQVLPGEGMLGLGSAFLIAGSDAVVAALWKVDDATTARFMQSFYAALADGQTTVVALESARRAIRKDEATRHPYYWAGFCLLGEPAGTLPLRRAAGRSWMLGLAALLVAGSGLVILRSRRAL
jgi:CHAT domain-containing protein